MTGPASATASTASDTCRNRRIRNTLRLVTFITNLLCAAGITEKSTASNNTDISDPWQLPFRGFRDPSEGQGQHSSESGGKGIPPLTIPRGRRDIHTLVLTECAKYQDWQTIVAAFAWRESGQPGNVTRVVNCSPKDTTQYGQMMMELMPTFWAREYIQNTQIKDTYAAYNKPGAVVDFLEKAPAEERYVIILDSDMLLHKPFLPDDGADISPGWAMGAAGYTYLKGVINELAMRHVSTIPPRNDTLAGPKGRRGDQVGGPYFMLMDDLRRVAPLWLSTTLEMRQDLQAWKDSGDKAPPGQPVWISEMYGYSFGAARAGVWHHGAHDFMVYPSYPPSQVPHVIHYGLHFDIKDEDSWDFDKHYYFGFDPMKCPPWRSWEGYNTSRLRGLAGEALAKARLRPPPKPTAPHPTEGIFPPPPHPDRLAKRSQPTYVERYRDLLSIFTVAQMNAAICEFHSWTCPWSEQLQAICGDAWELYLDVRDAIDALEFRWSCMDHRPDCHGWAKSGECEKMVAYMTDHCAVSCKKCTPRPVSEFVARKRTRLSFAGEPSSEVQKHADSVSNDDGVASPKAEARPSRRDFASLVKRCATAFEPQLDHASLGLCVRAAGLNLAYVRPLHDSLARFYDADDGDDGSDEHDGIWQAFHSRPFTWFVLLIFTIFVIKACTHNNVINWCSGSCAKILRRSTYARND
jgi:peptidyl serine alpha-galactosyltransferase